MKNEREMRQFLRLTTYNVQSEKNLFENLTLNVNIY